MSWLPNDFSAPSSIALPGTTHHLRPIHPDDTELDMVAVMGSRDRLWSLYGDAWGWPTADMTAKQDRADLQRHADEMAANESFNFALFDENESALLGCVYIDPPKFDGTDAEISWWVIDVLVDSDAEFALNHFIPRWIAAAWPFTAPNYTRATNDIRRAFDRAPALYDEIRPDYPGSLFDTLFARLPDKPSVIEVGPGTGQATRELLSRDARITAVELGPDLAQHLRDKFAPDRLNVITGDFETVGADRLPLDSFDAVVSATAYHWIDQDVRCTRPAELLKHGGLLAIIDLIQVESADDLGYFDQVQPIYERFGRASSTKAPTIDEAKPYMADELEESALFDSPTVHQVRWDQTYSTDEYRKLLLTYSGTQTLPEPDRSQMLDELTAVIDDHYDGVVTRPLLATITIGARR